MRVSTKYWFTIVACAGLLGAAPPATAQEKFPSRPIEIIVPTPPGGGTDITMRLLAELVEPILGQKVVVVNKGGAGGTLGMSRRGAGQTRWLHAGRSVERAAHDGAAFDGGALYAAGLRRHQSRRRGADRDVHETRLSPRTTARSSSKCSAKTPTSTRSATTASPA